jgi:hypothetical protein
MVDGLFAFCNMSKEWDDSSGEFGRDDLLNTMLAEVL